MKSLTKKGATIETIAKLANVSHTTVSRALNNSPLVKEVTKQRIKDMARKLHYVPNVNAKGLVGKKTFLIGLFFSHLETGTSASFFSEVINKAKSVLPPEYTFSIDSVAGQSSESRGLAQHRYDGIVVVSQSVKDNAFIDDVVQLQLPMVVLNRVFVRDDIPNFASNDYAGTVKMMEYAVKMGHRRFALIAGEPSFESSRQRKRAFLDVMRRHDLTVPDGMIESGNYLPESGYTAMMRIGTQNVIPTCVFCSNDDMAVGAIRAARDLGYTIPADISFIGYDDMNYARYLSPKLTTIRKPTGQIVEAGINALTRMLQGKRPQAFKASLFEPTLIIRDSVADLRK
ncbi:MAG: LacI family transcriptional regulator [Sporolactobacillus sp.]|jgi:LacI family transcriptional regulator|nr:LacI family transcriptional regulator [Sporolactobacillus sp.]